MSQPADVVLLGSITDVRAEHAGLVGVSGSHGGLFAAAVASRAGLRAVALNDAGRGRNDAGVAGVAMLDIVEMAGVTVDIQTARIGNAQESWDIGIVSFANATARRLGVEEGITLQAQIDKLREAPLPAGLLDNVPEARWTEHVAGTEVLCVDSASLIKPEDAGRIILTGSHGGLIGGDPARACKALARLVVFNDAGIGKEKCGQTRLPALDQSGVAAATVDCMSCEIGSAQTVLDTGIISAANETGLALGVRVGQTVQAAIEATSLTAF